MDDYEIRVLNSRHKTSALIAVLEASDESAIRSAERIAMAAPWKSGAISIASTVMVPKRTT